MQPIPLQQVCQHVEQAIGSGNLEQAEALLMPALDQMPDVGPLWFYAGGFFGQTGRHALASICYERAYALEPLPDILANLGACYRYMNNLPAARHALLKCLERSPNHAGALTNLAGTYVNEGNPFPGIEAGERAVAIDGQLEGKFNLALLHLEAGNFARGFDLYAEGKHRHREERDYFTPETEPPVLTPELHEQLRGQGKALIIWGEQGLGDELMFGTLMANVIKDYEVVLDCHPRLEWLHQRSSWAQALREQGRPVRIVPTRKERGEPASRPLGIDGASAKVAAGDLCRLYRRDRADFTWQGPTYHAPAGEARQMREQLESLAEGRRIIGLATRGGTVSTATRYRRLNQAALERLLGRDDLFFVGLDYEDMTGVAQWAAEKFPDRYYWPAAINFAWDYHHVAALIAATDAVITVPQSVMHLACGMGHPTHVLVPSCPDWRLGVQGEFVWYPGKHVHLHRQAGNDWLPVIDSALAALDGQLRRAA